MEPRSFWGEKVTIWEGPEAADKSSSTSMATYTVVEAGEVEGQGHPQKILLELFFPRVFFPD